ncbi:MAG: hypothetical protein N3G78_08265 [Desulfobacterota bacterium]|nr:hypothetical protein [Thermodesulfobacteriota bacterium]
MRTVRVWVCLTLVIALGLIGSGCAKPPEAEREAAKKAMEAAVSAGAEKYAGPDFEAEKKTWDTAESQMKEKKYKEAKEGYVNAKAGFEKAASAVAAGKKALTEEANALLGQLESAWKDLEATAKKLEKQLKEKKEAWAGEVKAIQEGLAKAKELIPTDPAGAKAKLEEVKGVIEKWGQTFKELTAPGAKPAPAKK